MLLGGEPIKVKAGGFWLAENDSRTVWSRYNLVNLAGNTANGCKEIACPERTERLKEDVLGSLTTPGLTPARDLCWSPMLPSRDSHRGGARFSVFGAQ